MKIISAVTNLDRLSSGIHSAQSVKTFSTLKFTKKNVVDRSGLFKLKLPCFERPSNVPVPFVQRDKDGGPVVLHDADAHVHVRLVPVVHATQKYVPGNN